MCPPPKWTINAPAQTNHHTEPIFCMDTPLGKIDLGVPQTNPHGLAQGSNFKNCPGVPSSNPQGSIHAKYGLCMMIRVLRINTKIWTLMAIKCYFENTFSELELCVKKLCNNEKSFPI